MCDVPCRPHAPSEYLNELKRFRFLAQFFSEHAIQYVARKDQDYSILWGASGRSIAAFLPERAVKEIYDRERTIGEGNEPLPSWTDFKGELSRIKELGYCVTRNQRFQGAHSIAAPILGADNVVVGCLGISMPATRYEQTRVRELGAMILPAAEELSTVARCAIEPSPRGEPSL
jgi:DNA-binding IclR family transcriptional regulator